MAQGGSESESGSDSDSDSDSQSDEESSEWSRLYPLKRIQKTNLRSPGNILRSEEKSDEEVDEIFHEVVKELLCWQESRKLLEEMACPVQRFLVALCLRKVGKGFISNVRDITPLIAKISYCIRGTVYMEFLKRKDDGVVVDKELGGLHVYVEDLVQSPFGFLKETTHLAATVAGDGSTLPQVSWLGNDEYTSLAIHASKRVDLQELRNLCSALLKEAETQMRRKVKMGMTGIKNWNWAQFDADDNLGNTTEGHSFVTAEDNLFVLLA